MENLNNKTINGYTLLHKIGEGGMAEVWYAENRIKKQAAVKFLKEEFVKFKEVTARFENEALVMVGLKHNNIRQVYDYALLDDRPCIIMEYIDGNDLKQLVVDGTKFSDEKLKQWWNQMADALNYTHAQGIVHRDIKPSNIFETSEAELKLLDFGIAKLRDSITITQTGIQIGTLMYMSPEQIEDSKKISYKSDLYSLAVTFYHLLTGNYPYDFTASSDYQIRKSIVETPLLLDDVPKHWQQFLLPYLHKNPEQRPELTHFPGTILNVQPQFNPDSTRIENVPVTPIISTNKEQHHIDESTKIEITESSAKNNTKAATPTVTEKQKKKRTLWPFILIFLILAIAALLTIFVWKPWESKLNHDKLDKYRQEYLDSIAKDQSRKDSIKAIEEANRAREEALKKPVTPKPKPTTPPVVKNPDPVKPETKPETNPVTKPGTPISIDKKPLPTTGKEGRK